MSLPRPTWLFDREDDWADLARFVAANASRLGVVWGPRRAGKSTLVAALADAAGGLYYEAVRQDPALSRDELGRVLAARRGLPNVRFDTWDEVIHTLVSQVDHPVTVLDEFGYLREASPELPSVIQRVIDGTRRAGTPRSRLILCGSAVAQLSHLLDRDNPLFGRAQLALVVDAFDFRAAANYWDIARWPSLAVAVHAVVGGLPGYRDIVGEAPSSPAGFDDWVRDSILASSSPLLEEDSLVLQAAGLEANVYRSILTAVAGGEQTPTHIALRTGRHASSLARPIENLVQAGLLHRVVDPLRPRRSRYELADPFLSFHHGVIRPHRTRLRRRQQQAVWAESQPTWHAQLLGPHFERLTREATLLHPSDFGLGTVSIVGSTVVADRSARSNHEVDVLALGPGGEIVAIGEAKHTADKRGMSDLARLERIRALLPSERTTGSKLLLFAANGAHDDLQRHAEERDDVEIVNLDRLYGHS